MAAMPTSAERSKAMKLAEKICRDRGVRLTQQRRDVLAIINASSRPLGAYEIMEAMRAHLERVAPPTVYRALDFLMAEGLIHKLESLHAFVGCRHPDHPHFTQFLICGDCGDVDELHNEKVSGSLNDAAKAQGFEPTHSTVEVVGLCVRCRDE